jgi:hypothetical protein
MPTVTFHGGTEAVQFGTDNATPVDGNIASQVGGYNVATGQPIDTATAYVAGTSRVFIGAQGSDWSAVLQDQHQSFNSATDLTNGESGILATATNGARPVSATELRAQDFVTLPAGMETTVQNAVTLGYLRPAANGRGFENTAKGAGPASTPSQPARQATTQQSVERRAEEIAVEREIGAARTEMSQIEDAVIKQADPNGAISHMGKLPMNQSIGMLVAAQRATPLTGPQLDQVATSWGVTKSEAEARIGQINGAMVGQFSAMASLVGVDPAAASKWIAGKPDTAMSVMQAHALRGDAKAWLPLLREFKRTQGGKK